MTTQPASLARDPGRRWLNASRVSAYFATVLLAFQGFGFFFNAWHSWTEYGHPGGWDFLTFWTASRLTLDGTPLHAYSWPAIELAARQLSPNIVRPGPWFYPPNFLLLVRPLAWLSAPMAYALFIGLSSALFVFLIRRALPMRHMLVWILAFPGLWLNAAQGQNACLTASLALAAFLSMRSRPVLAGIFIGLLSIKPHLAILFPVALACAGMWTTFIAAAVTATLFTAISIGVFGLDIVPIFLHGLHEANGYIASGVLPWDQTASLFATLRMAHVAVGAAYAAQACQAFVALCAVAWVWRNAKALEVRATALVAATFMMSPYIYNYDAVWLGVPLALIAARALRDGWLRGELAILGVAWLYPQMGDLLAKHYGIGLGPLVFASLIVVAIRRTRLEAGAVAVDPAMDRAR
ncbi:membrane protein [Caballeronia novacaledonica]|uniref:Membrane protein n=1 Tax=Caballeronia novacaledonica TaxID=1544861 RepID=A0A2U3HZZ6_9BURK|nr:glycosyltransferase family 87 protein [Caballeronia novacaledonica]SPB13391.1 membrane protein [Caballeronia novacaledonica]